MKRVQDISISDNNLKFQYVDDFLNENYNEAFNLINGNNFETKKITMDFFEDISSQLYHLEEMYFQNVPYFLAEKLNDIQYVINNLIFLGEWNSTTVYRAYNLVSWNNTIYMYIAENPSSGSLPSAGGSVSLIIDTIVDSNSYGNDGFIIEGGTINNQGILSTNNLFIDTPWLRLEIRGEKGAMGIGVNYRGNWDSSASYNQYDSVFYNDSLWACKATNQNVTPQNNTYWDEMFKVYKAKIEDYSSPNPYNGMICFETI